jgi:putative cell wall-binding protein
MLLVDPFDLSDSAATEAFITDNAAAIRTVLIAGGPEAISQDVADQVGALLAPS